MADGSDPPFPQEEQQEDGFIPTEEDTQVEDPNGDRDREGNLEIPEGDINPDDPLPFNIPDMMSEDEEKNWCLPDELASYFTK